MPFALMDCHFGIDGLESTYAVFTSNDSDDCYREWLKRWDDKCFMGEVFLVDSLDSATCKMVMVEADAEFNYPHWGRAPTPDFFMRALVSPEALKRAQTEIA